MNKILEKKRATYLTMFEDGVKDALKMMVDVKKKGWKPMETDGVGGAWFGGKSHHSLADYVPDKVFDRANLEDIDFLVLGWRA